MWLEDTARYLGWPKVDDVTHPQGGGPSRYAQTVKAKIALKLKRKFDLPSIIGGILSAAPSEDTAEAPLAIVLQFSSIVDDKVLREAQRLSWNFTQCALLVTLEPTRIQAWTCSLEPRSTRRLSNFQVLPAIVRGKDETTASTLQSEAAQALHWMNFVSGAFLKQNPAKFNKTKRADASLVANLRAVRKKLLDADLSRDICHALLARLIFTQFLFQRTDSDGRPAISQSILDNRCDQFLKNQYEHATALQQILLSKSESYSLFQWLNEKFNGDLFPGKGETEEEREEEWAKEKRQVTAAHLKILSDFVGGTIEIESGQQSLWPLYSFDALPLEFISSVYEEFLNEDQYELSAYYTPPHLVDFVLDGVLPWGGDEWDLKVLDPCCGSGIFLVKAFQRLVQRWKNAHPDQEPRVDDLRGLLENNLFGVDDNEDAIRVASFSLCLALCDAIDPKHYWKRSIFPPLRNVRLIKSDFFKEDIGEFSTPEQGAEKTWDLVIGNAPWRDSALDDKSLAVKWASENDWPVVDRNAGPLFLAKGAALTADSGHVSMIQPAATLLYQRSYEPSDELRQKLFRAHTVEEVVSFAHLRWQLFNGVKSPVCLVTLRPKAPDADYNLSYICPKPLYSAQDESVVAIEQQDVHEVSAGEGIYDPLIWTVLLSGSRRDANLVSRLSRSLTLRKLKAKSIEEAEDGQVLLTREGIKRGSNDQRDEPKILGWRMIESPDFPDAEALSIDYREFRPNLDPKVDRLHGLSNLDAFKIPQLLIKKSIVKNFARIQAKLVAVNDRSIVDGVLCTASYLSIHQFNGNDDWLRAIALAFRSQLSAYYLVLTSRLAFDRGEALSGNILDVPIPQPTGALIADEVDLAEVDRLVEDAFRLSLAERVLISDLMDFNYREGNRTNKKDYPSRKATARASQDGEEDDLVQYADFFLRTLKATFGNQRAVRATVYEEANGYRLPVRMVAIHLDWPRRRRLIQREVLNSEQLRAELSDFYAELQQVRSRHGTPVTAGLGFRRVARLFVTHVTESGDRIPTVLIVKPDERRYWSRSQGLRDADELAAVIVTSKKSRGAAK